ncbi:MAG: hypothetical protein GWO24_05835, partial [Akkermansiaceae bacterium]|nr:hypothetical protein [Akkermansiaceae bacterium]
MHQDYPIKTVDYSPNGQWVLTASNDRRAQIWDAQTGLPIGLPMLHNDGLLDAVFSPDSRRIATCSRDGMARVWSAPDGTPVSERIRFDEGIDMIRFHSGGTGLLTVSGGSPRMVHTWDLRPNSYLPTILP